MLKTLCVAGLLLLSGGAVQANAQYSVHPSPSESDRDWFVWRSGEYRVGDVGDPTSYYFHSVKVQGRGTVVAISRDGTSDAFADGFVVTLSGRLDGKLVTVHIERRIGLDCKVGDTVILVDSETVRESRIHEAPPAWNEVRSSYALDVSYMATKYGLQRNYVWDPRCGSLTSAFGPAPEVPSNYCKLSSAK